MTLFNEVARTSKGFELLSSTGRAVPGQSLTNSPDTPNRWEQPPEFVSVKDATYYLFETLLQEDIYKNLIKSLRNEVPVSDLASAMLYTGYLEGKFNPDLMMLLTEPLTYIILSLGELAGMETEEMIIYPDEEDEVDPEEGTKALKKAMEKVKLSGVSFTDTNLENILPEEVTEKIEEIKEEGSLLDKVEKPTNNSLLNRGK